MPWYDFIAAHNKYQFGSLTSENDTFTTLNTHTMTKKFYQSEDGNITVLALDHTLMIWTDTPGNFLVTNPDNSGVYSGGVGEIDVPQGATLDQILELIRAQTGKARFGTDQQKVPVDTVFSALVFSEDSGPGSSPDCKNFLSNQYKTNNNET